MTWLKRVNEEILLVTIALLATLWLQAPRLFDQFQVDQDFRTFYWMSRFQDPSLFPESSRYIPLQIFGLEFSFMPASPGYGFLFYLASFLVAPFLFSKLVPFVLAPITAIYLFKFGCKARGRGTGLVLAIVFIFLSLASPSSTSIATGLQRSFANSLIIILLYYLYCQQFQAAATVIVVSALIYPPMFVLGVGIWGLFITRLRWKPSFSISVDYRAIGLLIAASAIACLIMMPIMLPRLSNVLSKQETVSVAKDDVTLEAEESVTKSYTHLWDNPVYQTGGKLPLFFWFPFVGRGGLVNNGEDAVHILVLFCLSSLVFLIIGRRAFELPDVVWCMLWASLILFVLAWLSIWLIDSFLLYLPSRYTRVGLLLFLLIFVIWNGPKAVKTAMDSIRRDPKKLQWLIGGVALLVLGLIFLYPSKWSAIGGFNMKWLLAPAGFVFMILALVIVRKPPTSVASTLALNELPGGRLLIGITIGASLVAWSVYAPLVSNVDFLDPSPQERALLKFIATLPRNALLAGTPTALDNVPLFAKRNVLLNTDSNGADAQTTLQALNAYYADDAQIVLDFCQQYNVDYLVIDQTVYSENYLATEKIFFEPYHQELYPRIIKRDSFVLAQIPLDKTVFNSGPYKVIRCNAETFNQLPTTN